METKAKAARRKRFRGYTVPHYIKDSIGILMPPEDMTVSEWAESRRILNSKTTNIPGPWKNSVTPYLSGIMDEFSNADTEEIIFVKPTQVGGTEALQNMLGYIVDQDPAPTMIVYPTDKLAEFTSENRIKPMMKDSPALRKHFREHGSTKTELQFDNMFATLAGSNSPASLSSKPIRYLFLDEVDKYPMASKEEADPISLAVERTKTFRSNRKIYMCSTPTLKSGHIWKEMETADKVMHYFVPCPHCGSYIELKFAQIKWPGKETGMSETDRAELATYECQECGGVITDQSKPEMMRCGEWRTVKQKSNVSSKVAFWINTLYSPFTRFSDIAREFVKSKEDPDVLHNFTNSWLAEPWEEARLKTSADLVLARQTELTEYIVPDWTKLITGGIDVQENCLYWTIRAWGDYLTSQNIAHGQALSFQEVSNAMNLEYQKEDGTTMLVDLALIDSGDQTDEVYEYCAENPEWILPCKGSSGAMISHYKFSAINKAGSKANGMTLVIVDGGKYKDTIYRMMSRENGNGAWMVYKGCDREYADQVTAEQKTIERSKGRTVVKWGLKSTHAANHYLDTEVYCFAAADIMGVRTLFLQAEKDEAPEPGKRKNAEIQQPTIKNKEQDPWIPDTGKWI